MDTKIKAQYLDKHKNAIDIDLAKKCSKCGKTGNGVTPSGICLKCTNKLLKQRHKENSCMICGCKPVAEMGLCAKHLKEVKERAQRV